MISPARVHGELGMVWSYGLSGLHRAICCAGSFGTLAYRRLAMRSGSGANST